MFEIKHPLFKKALKARIKLITFEEATLCEALNSVRLLNKISHE